MCLEIVFLAWSSCIASMAHPARPKLRDRNTDIFVRARAVLRGAHAVAAIHLPDHPPPCRLCLAALKALSMAPLRTTNGLEVRIGGYDRRNRCRRWRHRRRQAVGVCRDKPRRPRERRGRCVKLGPDQAAEQDPAPAATPSLARCCRCRESRGASFDCRPPYRGHAATPDPQEWRQYP